MSLETICKTDVASIEKTATLKDVSEMMQEKHVGSIVVTENYKGRRIPCGIITDRDIALALGSSPKPQDLKVERIMLSRPVTARKSDGIYETMVKMQEYGIKRVPVIDSDGSLFGIVTADDLLGLVAEEIGKLAKIAEVQVGKEKGIRTPLPRTAQM